MRISRPTNALDTTVTGPTFEGISAWDAGTTYAVGAQVWHAGVDYDGLAYLYESLQASNTGHTPASSSTWWLPIGASNPYRMFDGYAGTQTTSLTGSIVTSFYTAQFANTVSVLNVIGQEVNVTIVSGGETVYNQTQSAYGTSLGIDDWYEYFFGDANGRGDFIFADLPSYPDEFITVTLTGDGTVAIGTLAVGFGYYIGETIEGAKIGINDYSRKSTDEFGVTTVVERAFSKTGSFLVAIPNNRVDFIAELLPQYRAKAVVWTGDDAYGSTFIYGFFKTFSVEIKYGDISYCTLEIEGLS